MGLDLGDKTIGISMSDELGWTAQGLEVIRRNVDSPEADFERLDQLIEAYQVSKVVLGLPKNMNGTVGPRGELCKEFGRILEERTGIPIKMWDERLSTVAAERMLISADVSRKKRKQVIDKMAAVIILQGFLDSNNN
jgi:putative Holliday junction resolvase